MNAHEKIKLDIQDTSEVKGQENLINQNISIS